jgi:ABC-type lipoprotein release transport system permease subunit
MYLSLSWRNIWRNKKRTLIIAASVFFAVILAAIMRSAQLGSYSYMIHSSAKLFTGYLQVQGQGYWDKRSLDNSMVIDSQLQKEISQISHVTNITPRLEGFALVSYGTSTKVGEVIGIDPDRENNMTGLKQRLVAGDYLTSDAEGALIGEGLAHRLKTSLGDSIVLYGQGYHGQIAAAKLPVTGIVKLPFQEMNNSFVFLALDNARNLFSAYNRITSLPIMIDNNRHLNTVQSTLRSRLNPEYAIMTWDQMMPDLVQNIQLDNASGIVMLIILYIVIGFGVFGTVMMMMMERTKEFGVLISVGMKKTRLMLVTTLESVFLSFIGVVAGIICSYPIIYYLKLHPILITGEGAKTFDSLGIEPIFNFSTDSIVFISQATVVFIIALATALYPIFFIKKIEPNQAIRA